MQSDPAEEALKAIRVVEMRVTDLGHMPTGRQIWMDPDALAIVFPKEIQAARETGAMAVGSQMFSQLAEIVREADESGSSEGVPEDTWGGTDPQ